MELCFLLLALLFVDVFTQGTGNPKDTSCPNFPGSICAPELTTCLPTFCLNNGVCAVNLGKPLCACPEGVTGKYCETVRDATTPVLFTHTGTTTTETPMRTSSTCPQNYCLNNGVCVDFLGKPVCACVPGVNGTHCEITPCTPDYCINQGVCVVVVGRPVCACPDGVTGVHCEKRITTTTTTTTPNPTITQAAITLPSACDKNPCHFGGSCVPLSGGRFECKCTPGHDPPLCLPGISQTAIPTTLPTITIATTTNPPCDNSTFDGCEAAEVVFMITYSKYEDASDIDHQGDYVKRLISQFQMAQTVDDHVRVGVVVYHDDVTESIHITDYAGDKSGLLNRVDTLTSAREHQLTPSGTADIARAFTFVRDNSFKDARPRAKKVVIPIIHHLLPDYSTVEDAANSLKQMCAQVFAKAVERPTQALHRPGGDIAKKVATSPDAPYYTHFNTFWELENAAKDYHSSCSGL